MLGFSRNNGRGWVRGRPPLRRLRITAFIATLVLVVGDFSAPYSSAAASPMPATPQQQSGTAAGRSHSASAASTSTAKTSLPNSAAGKTPGALPQYTAHSRGAVPTSSGTRQQKAPAGKAKALDLTGFNAATSVEQPLLDTANSIVYKNTDGTYTSHVYTHSVNAKQTNGAWARISASVTSNADSGGNNTNSAATYVESGVTQNFSSTGDLYVGQYNSSNYNSFLQFGSFGTQFPNAYIAGASLELDTLYSGLASTGGCSSQAVNVAPITANWSPSTLNTYPGPSTGAQIGTASFSAGTDCSNGRAWEGVPITNTSTLMNWAHGWAANYGLAVSAPLTAAGAKEFASTDAYLAITYTPNGEGANYSEVSYASPWNNAPGYGVVTVENEGSATWTPTNGFKLTYEIYTVSGTTMTLDTAVTPGSTVMPSTVAPNKSVTVTSPIVALTPGSTYDVCWDMENGTTKFSTLGVPPVCYSLPVINNPPVITAYYPDNNANVYTLTPTLGVSAYDPDNYPNKGLTYSFQIFAAGSTTALASASALTTSTWTVPASKLSYASTYYWEAQVSDTVTPSAWSAPDYFNVTSAPQPLVTSQLAVPSYGSTVQGVDPEVGNYTTVVTDANYTIPKFGPAMEVQRTYNSLNPEVYNVFGAGWSSILDMRITPDSDGSGNVVLTLATGQQERFGLNGDGTFSPPAGLGGKLVGTPLPGFGQNGYTYIDPSGVRYNFDEEETDPVAGETYWGLGNAWDANGHGLDFIWGSQTLTLPSGGTVSMTLPSGMIQEIDGQNTTNPDTIGDFDSGYGAALDLTWGVTQLTTSSGTTINVPHVTEVNSSGNNPWTYGYNVANQLTSVCPPATTTTVSTSCSGYSYTSGTSSGSHFASMVLSSNPTEYWRLDDAAGSTSAADSVAVNEGADNATLKNVTLGQAGALAGSPATSASFNGTSSYASLPANMMATSSDPTIAMWFKTTQAGGTLFSYQAAAPGTATSANYTPALYVGTDGKLHAQLYDGKTSPMSSTAVVDDGKWHYVVLTGNNVTQTLFIDGAQVATRTGSAIAESGESYDTIGAGEITGSWPDAPTANALGYFSGDIEDVNFLQHPLGLPEVQQEYSSGVNAAAELTQLNAPSGKTQDVLAYNALTDRSTSVTDADGGTYTIGAQSTSGSDNYYYGAMQATRPTFDYPMNDTSGLVAADDSGSDDPPGPATESLYNNVMLGEPGIFGANGDTAAGFNGSSSFMSLPNYALNDSTGNATVAMWFNTKTAGGVLFSMQHGAIGVAPSGDYTPVLYVGSDGKLYGQFWDNKLAPMVSTGTVDDGNWHLVVLTATGTTQTLYLDGAQIATRSGNSIAGIAESTLQNTVTVGAGYVAGTWPKPPTNAVGYFNGEIAQVGVYQLDIDQTTPTAEASLYQARGSSKALTPTTTVGVTDPGQHSETYTFDPTNGDRATAYTNAMGQTTTYAYDTLGFQDASTDPDGHTTSREHDKYGNVIETTNCETQASCQTSYYSYYEDASNALDPLNGKVLKAADARAGTGGTANAAYTTSYTYTPDGDIASATTPPTAGYPKGQTTSYTYYSGIEMNVPTNHYEPYGLLATETDPRGEETTYTYDPQGLVYSEADPSGMQKFYTYSAFNQTAGECVSSDTYPETQQPSGFGWDITVCPQTYSYTYEPNGQVATETFPATTDAVTGKTHTELVTDTYDLDGNLTAEAISDTTGGDATRTTQYSYNAVNRMASETDPDTNTTTYTYDDYGNLSTRSMPNGAVYSYTYTPTGLQLTTTLTNWTGNPESPSGSAALVTDSRAYDPAGRLASDTDSMGRVTAYTYFDDNLMATQTQASGTSSADTTAFTYDAAGNMTAQCDGQTSSGGCAKLTDYTVNAQNQMTQTTVDPAGVDQTTTDHFDPDGDLLSQVLTGGGQTQETSYTYDAAGDRTGQSVATGNTGPTGYWPLTDGDATTAADSSGNGNAATPSGGVTWAPPGGNAAVFNGTSGYLATKAGVVETDPDTAVTSGYTVSAWVNLKTASTTSDGTILSQDGNDTSAFQLEYNHTAKSWSFVAPSNDANAPTTTYSAPDPTAAQTGVWTQVVGVFTAGVDWMSLYVNGALVNGVGAPNSGSQVIDSTPIASTGQTAIGRGKANSALTNFFPGQIRDAQVFNSALTTPEISDMYASGSSSSESPENFDAAGYWKLNDGEAPAASDASGNGNAATLGGDSYWNTDDGGALVTDGTTGGGASTASPAVNTTGNFTVSAWAKLAATGTAWQTVATQQGNEAGGFSLDYDGATNRWAFDRAATDVASPTTETAQSSAAPTTGAWTHLVGVYTASTGAMQLYVNGAAQGTATDTTPIASNGPVDIGHGFSAGAAANYFNGEIRNVQTYNNALSSSQVGTLYTSSGTVGSAVSTTTWTYDERGYPKTMVSPDGNATGAVAANYTTTYAYNQLGEETSSSSPPVSVQSGGNAATTAVATTLTGYDTFGDVAENSDPDGDITTTTYNGDGQKTAVSLPTYTPPGPNSTPITPTATYQYNGVGEESSTTNAMNQTTSYVYDQLGNQVQTTAPNNEVTEQTFDTDGEQLSATDATGAVVQQTYNPLGQVLTATQEERYPSAQAYTTDFTFDALGDETGIAFPQGDSTTYTYNALGQRTSATNGLTEKTSYAYGLGGQTTKATEPDGTSTVATYDEAGRETGTQALNASGVVQSSQSFTYDAAGNQVTASDPPNAATTSTYNAVGDLVTQSQPSTGSTTITTSYGYDADGHKTAYTDANGNKTVYTYNTLGLQESEVEPTVPGYTTSADDTTTVAYNASGQPTSVTEPGGVASSYSYDVNGNMTGESGTGAEASTTSNTYGYNADNEMTSYSAPGGTNTVTYDDRGLPISSTGPSGNTAFTYDGDMRMTQRTDSTGTANFAYNLGDELTAESDPLTGASLGYSYNNDDQVSGVSYGTGGPGESISYNAQHEVTGETYDDSAGTGIASIGYQYNAAGEITNETTTGTIGAGSSTYTYDEAGRLTSDTDNGVNTAYAYDADGNLTGNGSGSANYDARDELTTATSGSASTSYNYTARGTMSSATTGSTTTAFTDNAFGQQITAGSGTYSYDSLGRLATASTNGTNHSFTYDGTSSSVVSDGTQEFGNSASGAAVSESASGAAAGSGSFLDTDLHDNVVGTFTGSGTSLSSSTEYSPWGQVQASTGTTSDLGYQSGWTDSGTGLVDAASRWYDPGNGDFTSQDTASNAATPAVNANPFAYANDNPLGNADPTGHDACSDNDPEYQKELAEEEQAEQEAEIEHDAEEMYENSEEQHAEWMKEDEAEQAAGDEEEAEWNEEVDEQVASEENDVQQAEEQAQEEADQASEDDYEYDDGDPGSYEAENGSDYSGDSDPGYDYDYAGGDTAADIGGDAAVDVGEDAFLDAAGDFLADYGVDLLVIAFFAVPGDSACEIQSEPGKPATPTEPPATAEEPVTATNEGTVVEEPAPETDGPVNNSEPTQNTDIQSQANAEEANPAEGSNGESGNSGGNSSGNSGGNSPSSSAKPWTPPGPCVNCARAIMGLYGGTMNAINTAVSEEEGTSSPNDPGGHVNLATVAGSFGIGFATGFLTNLYVGSTWSVSNVALNVGGSMLNGLFSNALTQIGTQGSKFSVGQLGCNAGVDAVYGLGGVAPDAKTVEGVWQSGGVSTASNLPGMLHIPGLDCSF